MAKQSGPKSSVTPFVWYPTQGVTRAFTLAKYGAPCPPATLELVWKVMKNGVFKFKNRFVNDLSKKFWKMKKRGVDFTLHPACLRALIPSRQVIRHAVSLVYFRTTFALICPASLSISQTVLSSASEEPETMWLISFISTVLTYVESGRYWLLI